MGIDDYHILSVNNSSYKKNNGSSKNKLVLVLKDEIEKAYTEKFSLQKFSERLFVNKDYLGRVFKATIGETPLRYHNYVRCEKAKIFLKDTKDTIGVISYRVGYQSDSHFIKVFKNLYGETPLQYRKSNKNDNRI